MAFRNQVVRRFSEYKDSPSAYPGRNRDAAENPFSGPCGLSHAQFFTTGSGFKKGNVNGFRPLARPLPPMRISWSFSLARPRPNSIHWRDTARAFNMITDIPLRFGPGDEFGRMHFRHEK